MFVSDKKMREFNKKFRDKDTSTDVLSFPADSEPQAGADLDYLGDILISTETAARQAQEIGHSFDDEITRLLVHGMLHLLGYDHQDSKSARSMRAKEKALLSKLD